MGAKISEGMFEEKTGYFSNLKYLPQDINYKKKKSRFVG